MRDAADYVHRTGPQGAELEWLIAQVAYLGYDPGRVSIALAVLVADGLARRDETEAGTVIRPARASA